MRTHTHTHTEALVFTSKEIGLEVNADKTKYMVMSRDQNARRSHNIKIEKNSFERVEQLKYFATNLTHQNSISGRNKELTEVRECLLSFSAESFVVEFAIQKYKDYDIQNYTFASSFVWV